MPWLLHKLQSGWLTCEKPDCSVSAAGGCRRRVESLLFDCSTSSGLQP